MELKNLSAVANRLCNMQSTECKNKCCVCKHPCYNKGTQLKDGIHRICSNCQLIDGQCKICSVTIPDNQVQKSWLKYMQPCEEARVYCTKHRSKAIVKGRRCKHYLCIRCLSEMLCKQNGVQPFQCIATETSQCTISTCNNDYPLCVINDVLIFLDDIVNKSKTYISSNNEYKSCIVCKCKSDCKRGCGHTYCMKCVLDVINKDEHRQLHIENSFENVWFCYETRCNTWIVMKDVSEFVKTIFLCETIVLKIPEERKFCSKPSCLSNALVELPCKHKYCLVCINKFIKTGNALEFRDGLQTFQMFQCSGYGCGLLIMSDFIRGFLEEIDMVVEICSETKDCDLCGSIGVGRFLCNHSFCVDCLRKLSLGKQLHFVKCPVKLCYDSIPTSSVTQFLEQLKRGTKSVHGKHVERENPHRRAEKDNSTKNGERGSFHEHEVRRQTCNQQLESFSGVKHEERKCLTEIEPESKSHNNRNRVQSTGTQKEDLEDISSARERKEEIENRSETETIDEIFDNTFTDPAFTRAKSMKGLQNTGLSCYANCILQVLAQTPGFPDKLQSYVEENNKDVYCKNIESDPLSSVLCELLNDLNRNGDDKHSTTVSSDKLNSLMDIVCGSDSSFHYFEQNDSHSFLMYIFTWIDDGIDDRYIDHKGALVSLFQGEFETSITCRKCNHVETTCQMFRSINIPTLEIQIQSAEYSITKGLENLTREEYFTQRQLPCRHCKVGRRDNELSIVKSMRISKLPDVFILQIGRADQTYIEYRGRQFTYLRKNFRFVQYPMELTLQEGIVKKSEAVVVYHLYGVVLHSGTLDGGHYTALVKSRETHKWYFCNDTWIDVENNEESITNERNAYLLFYEKVRG